MNSIQTYHVNGNWIVGNLCASKIEMYSYALGLQAWPGQEDLVYRDHWPRGPSQKGSKGYHLKNRHGF